jgi:ubiquinone/menaquinone biosynthesis C-methylase UbiE
MLPRVLETEIMDTHDEAWDYDAMDHSEVNRVFVTDFLAAGPSAGLILDLGTGTAQVPMELCRRTDDFHVLAVDAAVQMLELARYNIEIAGLIERIQLAHVDAKRLPYPDDSFAAVMSNSLIHHLPDPVPALADAVRVTAPQGLLFFRDLLRPDDDQTVQHFVTTYAGQANDHQRQMFNDSLRAALRLEEIRELVLQLGFSPETVQTTSDRHWTWTARKP